MQKGSAQLFILIVIILAFLTIGYTILSSGSISLPLKSPAGTYIENNLTTYTNDNLGFIFKYDDNLKIIEDSEEQFNKRGNGDFRKNFKYYITYEPGKFLGAIVVLDESKSYETNPLTIWVFENLDNLTIDSWYKDYWYYPFVWGDFTQRNKIIAPVNEATISAQIAKSGAVDYQPGKPKFIYLSKNQKMYLFRIIGEKGDKILENFKFK